MRPFSCSFAVAFLFYVCALGQAEGGGPSASSPVSMNARLVYGRVQVQGVESGAKPPMIYVTLFTRRMHATRTTLDNDGFYYFRDIVADGGTVMVEVNGTEMARQTLLTFGPKQQRMDFQVTFASRATLARPGIVTAKYVYERSKENAGLMEKAVRAIEDKKHEKAVVHLRKLITNDPQDYPAWTILGAAYSATSAPTEAENAFATALKLKPDSVPTMVSLGKLHISMKRYDAAIEQLESAVKADPAFALAYRLIGEAYLQVQKGSKAIPALNEAIRLQPIEMAECHLMLAKLYDIVGAKHLASAELKQLLEKIPDHPEKEKIKAYIKLNPAESQGR